MKLGDLNSGDVFRFKRGSLIYRVDYISRGYGVYHTKTGRKYDFYFDEDSAFMDVVLLGNTSYSEFVSFVEPANCNYINKRF